MLSFPQTGSTPSALLSSRRRLGLIVWSSVKQIRMRPSRKESYKIELAIRRLFQPNQGGVWLILGEENGDLSIRGWTRIVDALDKSTIFHAESLMIREIVFATLLAAIPSGATTRAERGSNGKVTEGAFEFRG